MCTYRPKIWKDETNDAVEIILQLSDPKRRHNMCTDLNE